MTANDMTAHDIGKKLVAFCKEGRNEEAAKTLYSDDIESVEAGAPPGSQRSVKGLAAVLAKGVWWAENHTVHSAEAHGPYPHGDDRFAVRFVYDITNKPQNKRMTLDEVAVFHVAGGKIIREEFFYAMG